MTLKELSAYVTGTKKKERMTKSDLLNSRSLVIEKGEHGNGTAYVYQNGYILYKEYRFYTIFHISDVLGKNALYETANEGVSPSSTRTINADYLENLEWIIPIAMWGNARIIHNLNNRELDHRDFRYCGMPEDWSEVASPADETSDLEQIEDADEAAKIVEEIKIRIVPTQWKVFVGKVVHELTDEELGTILNISHQAVNKRYKKAIKRIERAKDDVLNPKDKTEE